MFQVKEQLDPLRLPAFLPRDPRDNKLEDKSKQNAHGYAICRPWQQCSETYLSDAKNRCVCIELEDPCARQHLVARLVLSDFEQEPRDQWIMIPGVRVTREPGTWDDWRVALRTHAYGRPDELAVFRKGQSYAVTELPDYVIKNLLYFAERPPPETRSPLLKRFPFIAKIFPPLPVPAKPRLLERLYLCQTAP
jgi:hypothetical protein